MNVAELPMRLMRKLNLDVIDQLEDDLAARPDAVHANIQSPERFEIIKEALDGGYGPPATLRAMPHMMGSMRGIRRSLSTVDGNPSQPRARMPEAELAELEAYARSVDVDDMGYARLPASLVFRHKAVLHENVIVLTMEMDKARMDTSPSADSFVEVHRVYNTLGQAANRIAGWLRERGYSAQAGHPLMGQALYPPLGQQAGLGWRGLHGLLITPEFGPRVRLAAVYTSIGNLPQGQENPHGWIEGFCRVCLRCAKDCPPQAILEEPLVSDTGLITCTVNDKCFPYFVENYGCSICIRICPFQRRAYGTLKKTIA